MNAWRDGAVVVFGLTVVVSYYLAWSELPFKPIKLSWLGRGVAYPVVSLGFALAGGLLARYHVGHKLLVLGDLLFMWIGIVNGHSWHVRVLHLLIVVGAFGCYSAEMLKRREMAKCWLLATFVLLDNLLALINQHLFPQDPVTFVLAALSQYAAISIVLHFIFTIHHQH